MHTPGPWKIAPHPTFHHSCPVVNCSNDGIGIIADNGSGRTVCATPEGNKPDARLIAAAPDLLAALEGLVDGIAATFPLGKAGLKNIYANKQGDALFQARAAIAKAKQG